MPDWTEWEIDPAERCARLLLINADGDPVARMTMTEAQFEHFLAATVNAAVLAREHGAFGPPPDSPPDGPERPQTPRSGETRTTTGDGA